MVSRSCQPNRDRNSSAVPVTRSRSAATKPIRVRRSTMSSTVSAPSWVMAYSNSARVTSMPSATASAGRSQVAVGEDVGGLGAVPQHQRLGQSGHRRSRRPRVARRAHQRQVSRLARPGVEVAQLDCAVEDILGHVPVFGELAADHADQAGRRLDNGVVARYVGGVAGAGVDQRPQPRIGADDVVAVQRDTQRGVHHVQQEGDLPRGRLWHIGNGSGRFFVGQAQVDPSELFGHGEDESVELAGDRNGQRRCRDCRTSWRRTRGGCRGWGAASATGRSPPPTLRWH